VCLILFSYNQHPDYQLILAANRDEYYDRPTRALSFWEDEPNVLAGRDIKSNGTWLGMSRTGRFGAITNYRDPATQRLDAPSRGVLVSNFLSGSEAAHAYLETVESVGHHYNGFNLLIGDSSGLWHYSNRGDSVQKLNPGLFGLSNRLLDTPWPKVKKGKAELLKVVKEKNAIRFEDLFAILANKSRPPDKDLPQTGVDLEWERLLSPIFITSDVYGTRSSSIILLEKTGKVTFVEQTFDMGDTNPMKQQTRKFSFTINE
jgi:uncharacterized protein with NRDE domain